MSDKERLIKKDDQNDEDDSEGKENEKQNKADNSNGEDKEANETEHTKEDADESIKTAVSILEEKRDFLFKQEDVLRLLALEEKEILKESEWLPCDSCEFTDPIEDATVTCCFGFFKKNFSRHSGIRELWLVSSPGDKTPQEAFDKLKAATHNKGLSVNYKFHIPISEVTTIGHSLELIDALEETDKETEDVLRKLNSFMGEILEKKDSTRSHLLANEMDLATYLTRFTWNNKKYPIDVIVHGEMEVKKTDNEKKDEKAEDEDTKDEDTKDDENKDENNKDKKTKDEEAKDEDTKDEENKDKKTKDENSEDEDTVNRIVGKDPFKYEVYKISNDLKIRQEEHSNLQSSLEKAQQDMEGSLLTRSLDKLVKKEDFVLNSMHMTTVLVVIPKSDEQKWLEIYETLSKMVVPKSSKKLHEDETHSLFTAVVFKKFVPEFEENIAKQDFVIKIRKFKYDAERGIVQDEFLEEMQKIKEGISIVSYRWVKVKFSQCFVLWIHVKALRIYVESVLRYGVPPNFQVTLMIPLKAKKLRKALDKLYKDIAGPVYEEKILEQIPGELAAYDVKNFTPYVFITVATEFTEVTKD